MTTALALIQGKLRFIRRFFKKMWKTIHLARDQTSPIRYSSECSYPFKTAWSEVPRGRGQTFRINPLQFTCQGSTKSPQGQFEQGSYYSTFHKTPERKRLPKEEGEKFTKEDTREALKELVSSPYFNCWAVANAERITLTPPDASIRRRMQGLFRWF